MGVQPEPPRAGVSAGEAWMWRRVNLRGQKSRPGAHAWRGTAWGACARKGRGDGEQGGWGSGAGAGKVGEMMDDGWVRSRAQRGRVRAHLSGEGPPSSPPANVVIGAVGEGLGSPKLRTLARCGRGEPASNWRQAANAGGREEPGVVLAPPLPPRQELQPPFFTAFSLRLGKFVQSQRARDVEHVGGNESIR